MEVQILMALVGTARRITLIAAISILSACGSKAPEVLPFPTQSVRAVSLERVTNGPDPNYPTSPSHDTLAADRIAEFVEGMRDAEKMGQVKVWSPYRIIFTLIDGSRHTLLATETAFGASGDGVHYAFKGGRYFLRHYFPAMFEDTVGTVQNI